MHLRVLADDTKVIDPNTVTVMLVDEIAEKAVRVHLLDATSGAELARLTGSRWPLPFEDNPIVELEQKVTSICRGKWSAKI